ncbi:MAG: hypothetical protein NZ553_15830 [Caldilinea sp.]|nr:hypothetical protein [Caldilinea sp.]MDW8441946.1 GntR family transcriptional regulator YhfZ [Caldilineaceae bacterium]
MASGTDRDHRTITQDFMTRQGRIVVELARLLAEMKPGERLLPVQDYAELFHVGAGTVQSALDYLQDSGAARLEARGRLGTYVAALDYVQLWRLGYRRPMVGALPLPYSRHVEGLATALHAQFAEAGVELTLRFMRGSSQRLQALAQGAVDWVLLSRFAAETAAAHGFTVTTVVALGEYTYLAGHVLLLRDPTASTLRDGDRLGVDFLSSDHTYISRAVSRGRRVDLVSIQYDQALDLLAAGTIDAVVWTNPETPAALDHVAMAPLTTDDDLRLPALGEAVLVADPTRPAVANLLQALIDIPALLEIQRTVVNRARTPSY